MFIILTTALLTLFFGFIYRFKKVIMSLPEAPPDLNFVSNLYHKRKCYKCNAPDQKTSLFIER